MPQKTALIYARQSSGKEEDSESIEMQINHCKEIALKQNLKIEGIFSDANTSGRLYPTGSEKLAQQDEAFFSWFRKQTSEKQYRTGLGEALTYVHKIDFLLVDDLTRIARPVAGSFLQDHIMQKLMLNNITILTVKDGKVDYSNFADRLMSDLQSNINDNQIKIQTQKSRDAMKKLKDSGFYPNQPRMFGIKYLGNKKVAVIPECAEVIKFIFAEILKYNSYSSIVAEVNKRYKNLFEKACYLSTFKHIATQPFYCGYMYNTESRLIVAQQMRGQEIVSYTYWKKVQEVMSSKRKGVPSKQFRSLPFSGILYCGGCGARLVSGFDKGKSYYTCFSGANLVKNPVCCKARTNISMVRPSANYTGLKAAIAPLLIFALYKELEKDDTLNKNLQNLEKLEQELATQEEKLEEALELFMRAELLPNILLKLAQKGTKKIIQLQDDIDEIKRLQNPKKTTEKINDHTNISVEMLMTDQLTDDVYETLLRKSIKSIICNENNVHITTIYGEFTLPRYMDKNFRNFPKYRWKKSTLSDNKLQNHKFEITYIYDIHGKDFIIMNSENVVISIKI